MAATIRNAVIMTTKTIAITGTELLASAGRGLGAGAGWRGIGPAVTAGGGGAAVTGAV